MKERWDIEVRFLNGPLANRQVYTYRGPQVSIGSDPGVGGMQIRRPMISRIHARIDCSKGQVNIHPIEYAEVRVATHMHEDWGKIDPIYKPVPLMDGNVVYIGPLGHGIVFVFERTKTFDWQAEQLSSVVDQKNQVAISLAQNTKAKTIQVNKYPMWFFPTLIGMVSITVIFLFIQILGVFSPELPPIGPRYKGYKKNVAIDISAEVESSILQGFQAPFEDFVMADNQKESGMSGISNDFDRWDQTFYKAVLQSVKHHSQYFGFWRLLDAAKDDYAFVVDSLRDGKIPEVFAGIPFQETRYKKNLISPVCAAGIWQFMPETGKRMGLDVRDCKLDLTGKLWSPIEKSPPYSVSRDAIYVRKVDGVVSCRIGNNSRGTSCATDERVPIRGSTKSAVKLLAETYKDADLSESGSLIQATIMAHNAGYDDSLYLGRVKRTNVLPAYLRYRKKSKRKDGISFYGDNLCPKKIAGAEEGPKCSSFLHEETQHYAYNAIAFHILAVCYYAKNYGGEPAFKDWERYLDGYCKDVHAPDRGGK